MTDSKMGRNRKRRGVSLIEVLVVLVLLVLGILVIIRLFPSGFFSIQSTANAGLADSLGVAAVQAGAQDSQGLPEAILPPNPASTPPNLLPATAADAAASANYDPDDPNNLENARVVSNETITVPSVSNGRSVYVVKYGPVVMPADPSQSVAVLQTYFTVNSPNWTPVTGNSALQTVAGSNELPQDTLVAGQEQFLVDLTAKKLAVPYAPYTPNTTTFMLTNGQTVHNADSYPQKMVAVITFSDGTTGTVYLDMPAGTARSMSSPYAPMYTDAPNHLAFLPDTAYNYQGGWFDPATQYADPSAPPNSLPSKPWSSVTLYRAYNGIKTGDPFDNDPYEFKLLAANFGPASTPTLAVNPGSIGFNPKAAGGVGAQARKAKISYVNASWSILHEDHDIPALSGSDTAAIRTTVPNLLLAGSANPDNSINPGLAGSNKSIVILDLDTGLVLAKTPFDPTTPDAPINNEDLNGTSTDPAVINVSYALGRLTFGSNAFGDNTKTDGSGNAPAHRIRIYYTADLNWTVAVQKAPAYFQATALAAPYTGTTALAANEYALDAAGSNAFVYFARCNAGKTVEIDGTYTANGSAQGFSDTVAIDPTLNTVGDSDVRVDLRGTTVSQPIPSGATAVTVSAVRGLSARAVVAWKERNQFKVHTVDTLLNRTP